MENTTEKNVIPTEDRLTEKEEFRMEVALNDLLPEELISQGFRKLSESERIYFEPVLRTIPEMLANNASMDSAEKCFNEAVEGTYKLRKLEPGKILIETQGGVISAYRDVDGNLIEGNAIFDSNNAKFEPSVAPQVALGVFNALSVITQQYFLAEINAKLGEIKNGIDGLMSYTTALKKAELAASFREMKGIVEHLQYIKENPERKKAELSFLDGIRRTATENILFHEDHVLKTVASFSKKNSRKVVKKNLDSISEDMVQYHCAVYIYNMAQLLKVYLNDITDAEELAYFKADIDGVVSHYKEVYRNIADEMVKYVDSVRALNMISGWQIAVSVAGIIAFAPVFLPTAIVLGNATVNRKRKNAKEECVLGNQKYREQFEKEMKLIDDSAKTLDGYIESAGKGAEIASVEGELYVRYAIA